MVDTHKIKDDELDRLLEALIKESRERTEIRHALIEKFKEEQFEFLTKYKDLVQQVVLVLQEVDIDKSLDQAYRLFESVVSSLQAQLQEKKEEQT